MANCGDLIKAIDAYIAKADSDLESVLDGAGFVEPVETVKAAAALEDKIADALVSETGYITTKLKQAVDLDAFAPDVWPEIQEGDDVDERLAKIFLDEFQTQMPKLAGAYIKKIDPELTVKSITQRTTDWAKSWSGELGALMKLTSHNEVERVLINSLKNGKSVADFAQALMESGVRDEYYKARRAALTEMLRAHSVAQQEALVQNPAAEDKEWVHTGAYRNEPRANHVALNGTIVPKDEPFTLYGADGGTYYPMYPRDTSLPAGESISCHCIHRGIVNADVLGLPLDERRQLQQEAIDADDDAWEKELDARNKAKAGIDEKVVYKPSEEEYNAIRLDIQDNYNLALNVAHQNRHILNASEYIEGRSVLAVDAEELLKLYQGKSELRFAESGKWINKEFFAHTEVIGTWKSADGKNSVPTMNGMILYSKRNGVHIVPRRP
jgi:hypothetical protein